MNYTRLFLIVFITQICGLDANATELNDTIYELGEVTVKGQKSAMKLEVDRKSFDVKQMITNAGEAASDILEKIPSVEVDNQGNVSLRGDENVEIWINGKSSGITSDNRAQILQQLPAESIDHIEVIDNPSAKFSAEGSAGIINIVLKKDRKAGYYGSVQAGVDTRGGANTSFNINYSSKIFDAYANIGYRHRKDQGLNEGNQEYLNTKQYQRYSTHNDQMGNNLFTRAGITFHATSKDDVSLSGMLMTGKFKDWSTTPYHIGTIGAPTDTYIQTRNSHSATNMNMYYGEFNYRHHFTDKHFLDFVVDINKWKANSNNWYQDSTDISEDATYQYRPLNINNREWEIKLDYENPITENFKIQAGYQGQFSHENTPQKSYEDSLYWDGRNAGEDKLYYNRFIYDMNIHALYFTAQYNNGKFGAMLGLRGEYWNVNTKSYTWQQEYDPTLRDEPFKKDYFQLFPSVFLSYQLTKTQQLQLNYTRRLSRPWGGQLNNFKDTRDATMVSFGNPELTPSYSNSFSVNYLKTWDNHSMLVSAYCRPTSDVIQRVKYQSSTDGVMYQTSMNVTNDLRTGLEVTVKNHLFRVLDLTTNLNGYYYKIDDFDFNIDGQDVSGAGNHNFTWNARMMADVMLPKDISFEISGRYRSRRSIAQGYRKANYNIDLGARKNFFDKKLTLSINCRDLLNSRKFRSYTSSETFTRNESHKWGSRTVDFTLTWNCGNMNAKKRQMPQHQQGEDEEPQQGDGYAAGGMN